ncbi:MAG: hypothetical protein ACLSHC_09980 [Bilophila wadsworthia]
MRSAAKSASPWGGFPGHLRMSAVEGFGGTTLEDSSLSPSGW